MKTTIIHHSADYDGIFCREIGKKFLPEAEVIGWDFADPPLDDKILASTELVIMDLPVDRPFGLEFKNGWICKNGEEKQPIDRWDHSNVIWIDHHKSSIESHPNTLQGYRIDGVAACRLAWQWFNHSYGYIKRDFVDRRVQEPWAVRLAGEYDVWDKRDLDAEVFQYSLRTKEMLSYDWSLLLQGNDDFVRHLLENGRVAQFYGQRTDASTCKSRSWLMQWEGLNFLCVNTARFNSLFFAAKDIPETGHDALLGFCFNGKLWTVSLYHAKHRTDLDLSQIAIKHGGGGHRGACGFTCKTLPFNL